MTDTGEALPADFIFSIRDDIPLPSGTGDSDARLLEDLLRLTPRRWRRLDARYVKFEAHAAIRTLLDLGCTSAGKVTSADLRAAADRWAESGMTSSAIIFRLARLGDLGIRGTWSVGASRRTWQISDRAKRRGKTSGPAQAAGPRAVPARLQKHFMAGAPSRHQPVMPTIVRSEDDPPALRRGRRRPPLDQRGPTLTQAIDDAVAGRWQGLSSATSRRYLVEKAARLLKIQGLNYVSEVGDEDLLWLANHLLAYGNKPSTVRSTLSALSTIGLTRANRIKFRIPKVPKWYLRTDDQERLKDCPGLSPIALAVVNWTCATGLRIGETLKLRWRDIDDDVVTLDRGPLPISAEAFGVIRSLRSNHHPDSLVFAISYRALRGQWQLARKFLGVDDIATATLRSLRLSFAHRARLKGMPSDVLRAYLGQADLATTERWLHAVGGSWGQEQATQWLSRGD